MTDGTKRILAVDDNRMNRLKLVRGLAQEGYDIAEAEGGRTALEMLRNIPFDLVLLDILMPEVDGFQVLREMKGDPGLRDIPVIVISALDEMESVNTCIEMGAADYLSKPVDLTTLKDRVGTMLNAG